MIVRFVEPGGFFDVDLVAVPRVGETVRLDSETGPRLRTVREIIWNIPGPALDISDQHPAHVEVRL